jgi:hypothetical protein
MNLTTVMHKLFVARPEAAANSDFSDNLATEGDFANKPDGAVDLLNIVKNDPTVDGCVSVIADTVINGIEFNFAGGNADGDAFTWRIYGWRNENGPARVVCDGTGVLGSQAVVKYPHNKVVAPDRFWADTIGITNDRWIKGVEVDSDGGNSVGSCWFDCVGYRYFYVEILTSVGDMSVYIGYF